MSDNKQECGLKKEICIVAGDLTKLKEWINEYMTSSTGDPDTLEIIEDKMKRFQGIIDTLCHLAYNDTSDFVTFQEGRINNETD